MQDEQSQAFSPLQRASVSDALEKMTAPLAVRMPLQMLQGILPVIVPSAQRVPSNRSASTRFFFLSVSFALLCDFLAGLECRLIHYRHYCCCHSFSFRRARKDGTGIWSLGFAQFQFRRFGVHLIMCSLSALVLSLLRGFWGCRVQRMLHFISVVQGSIPFPIVQYLRLSDSAFPILAP